jgi:hypothetical protein
MLRLLRSAGYLLSLARDDGVYETGVDPGWRFGPKWLSPGTERIRCSPTL